MQASATRRRTASRGKALRRERAPRTGWCWASSLSSQMDSSSTRAVACMRSGAFDYLVKPFTVAQLEVVLRKAEVHHQLLQVVAVNQQADEFLRRQA